MFIEVISQPRAFLTRDLSASVDRLELVDVLQEVAEPDIPTLVESFGELYRRAWPAAAPGANRASRPGHAPRPGRAPGPGRYPGRRARSPPLMRFRAPISG